jgi:hypothetical protein
MVSREDKSMRTRLQGVHQYFKSFIGFRPKSPNKHLKPDSDSAPTGYSKEDTLQREISKLREMSKKPSRPPEKDPQSGFISGSDLCEMCRLIGIQYSCSHHNPYNLRVSAKHGCSGCKLICLALGDINPSTHRAAEIIQGVKSDIVFKIFDYPYFPRNLYLHFDVFRDQGKENWQEKKEKAKPINRSRNAGYGEGISQEIARRPRIKRLL